MPRPNRPAGLSVRLLLALVVLPAFSGCGGDSATEPPPAADRVEVTIPAAELAFGESTTAAATVYDEEGGIMSGAGVTWSSSDPGVAAVSGGVLTATGVGTATITARAGAAAGSADVDVVRAELELMGPSGPVPAYTLLAARLPSSPALELSDSVYAGVVGGDTVFLSPAGDTALAGLIPDLGDGARTLAVELGRNARATLELAVEAAPAIADPGAEIEAAVAAVEAVIDSVAAAFDTVPPSLGGDEVAAIRLLLDDIRADVLALDAAGKQELAAFLAANPGLWDGSAFNDGTSPAAGYEVAALTRQELGWKLLGFVATMAGVHASIELTVAAVRACQRNRFLRVGCGLAIGVPVAALVANAVAANVSAEAVLNTVFKPYEEMVAELDGGTGLLRGPGEVAAMGSSGAAGPFELYDGYPLKLGVTQTFATLEASDTDRVTGDVGAFLYALVDFRSYWVDVRLLLEQIARDLGREVSLTGVVAGFRDPPRTETWSVGGGELEVVSVSDGDAACSLDGDATLRLVCTTDATEPREITVTVGYDSDFGTQSLAIQGTLDPEAPPFAYTVTTVGTLGGSKSWPVDINDAGQVIGGSRLPGDSASATFLWRNGTMRTIDPPSEQHRATAVAINESGAILFEVNGRYSYIEDGPSIWRDGVWEAPLDDSLYHVLDMNETEQVLGSWWPYEGFNAVVWTDGTKRDVGPAGVEVHGTVINNAGQVLAETVADDQAFVWTDGSIQEIPVLPDHRDAVAFDMNDAGHVVGWSYEPDVYVPHGWLWRDGQLIDLGRGVPGAVGIHPKVINDHGHIVGEIDYGRYGGSALFFWADGVFHVVDYSPDPDRGISAVDLNNEGQILGSVGPTRSEMVATVWTVDTTLLP